MIAPNGRLDEARRVTGCPLELILPEANRHHRFTAAAERRVSLSLAGHFASGGGPEMLVDRAPYQRAQFVFVHSTKSS
jgi:hypothetical protein